MTTFVQILSADDCDFDRLYASCLAGIKQNFTWHARCDDDAKKKQYFREHFNRVCTAGFAFKAQVGGVDTAAWACTVSGSEIDLLLGIHGYGGGSTDADFQQSRKDFLAANGFNNLFMQVTVGTPAEQSAIAQAKDGGTARAVPAGVAAMKRYKYY